MIRQAHSHGLPQRAHQSPQEENPFTHGMRVYRQGQTGWAGFGAGGTGKGTTGPGRALLHPTDEDLSIHPSEQRSLAGGPESVGTPVTVRRAEVCARREGIGDGPRRNGRSGCEPRPG